MSEQGKPVAGLAAEALFSAAVRSRLARLRELAVVERDQEARERLARERPPRREMFEQAVSRRLRELRALCELSSHLQRAGLSGSGPPR